MSKQFGVRFDDGYTEAISQASKEENRTEAGFIRAAVAEYLKGHHPRIWLGINKATKR